MRRRLRQALAERLRADCWAAANVGIITWPCMLVGRKRHRSKPTDANDEVLTITSALQSATGDARDLNVHVGSCRQANRHFACLPGEPAQGRRQRSSPLTIRWQRPSVQEEAGHQESYKSYKAPSPRSRTLADKKKRGATEETEGGLAVLVA